MEIRCRDCSGGLGRGARNCKSDRGGEFLVRNPAGGWTGYQLRSGMQLLGGRSPRVDYAWLEWPIPTWSDAECLLQFAVRWAYQCLFEWRLVLADGRSDGPV